MYKPNYKTNIYFKFYNLEFLPDGYPGKKVEDKVYAHPMYGAYLLEDYLREWEKQNKKHVGKLYDRQTQNDLAASESLEQQPGFLQLHVTVLDQHK